MSAYDREIERISRAESLDAIREIVRELDATATREGGVLYSGNIGTERSERLALQIASERGLPIINDTPRAIFLSDERVIEAIDSRAREILVEGGLGREEARAVASNFRYGDSSLPRSAELSVERSLWGEASRDFARSLRGDVEVVATNARPDRVMGRVEIPAVIEEGQVRSLGGVPLDEVSRLHAQGGAAAVLDRVQAPMRALADAGLPPPRMSLGGRVATGATIVGAALTVAEGNEAIQRSGVLYDMGNETGARSELIHFGARSVGAWGGAALGAGVGAAGTSWSGPGAVIGGIVGGAAGLVGGQYVADYLDHRSIYRQQDAQGYTYSFDPENPALGWRRTETIDQIGANGQVVEQRREVVASGVLASQLDRQATTVSLDLMLARPPVPRDPYSLPAAPGDAVSAQPSSWQRDPASGEWRRNVYEWRTDTIEPGFTSLREVVTADPARAAQLDAQSEAILRENVHLAPAAMAARYELAYHDRGWRQHGELPESARTALANDGRLAASDGAEYQRQADGRWERQAYFGLTTADADPRIAAELDATRALLQEGLREHRAMMAERPQPEPPTFEDAMTATVARAYARQGLQPSTESIETMGRAMAADYRARGIDAPFMLQLERDPVTKQYGPDSPMGLYTRGADGDMALRFTMTPAEAREVLAAPPRAPESPAPATPTNAPATTPALLTPTRADAMSRDPLNESMREFVHAMDRSLGRTPDEASDRVAAALAAEWRANGLKARPEGVVLGQKGTRAEAGEYVFAYSGPSERPTDFVGVRTAEAVQTPVEQSLAKADTLAREQALDAQRIAQVQQSASEAARITFG